MNVRIQEVALKAQVSTATVSRSLHGLPGVSDTTRARVLETAAKLGYTPSHSATSLASGLTRSVGLVLPDVSRWFFANTVEIAEQTLRQANYDALIYTLPDYQGGPRPRFNPDVLKSKVDVIGVLSLAFDQAEVRALQSMRVPTAFLSVKQEGFSHVGINDEAAMKMACEHLIGLGHRFIGHLSGMTNDMFPNAPTQRRRNAWRSCLEQHGLDADASLDSPARIMTAKNGYIATKRLLNHRPDITAIVASSDEMAFGAIHALHDRGLVVGVDVSVAGIDGNEMSEFFELTTVAQPIHAEARELTRLLLASVSGDSGIHQRIFPVHLITRQSTGPAPR